jgi:hypothetical protein
MKIKGRNVVKNLGNYSSILRKKTDCSIARFEFELVEDFLVITDTLAHPSILPQPQSESLMAFLGGLRLDRSFNG